jgi:all-trans-retinol 13,14-reductase
MDKRGRRRDAEAIIIGAGLGGLVAGAYLSRRGVKVLVFEQHRQPGGYFTTFRHKGYAFDGGIQGCEDSGMLLNMFRQLGLEGRVRFSKSRYAVAVGDAVSPMADIPDLERMYDALAGLFPADAAALKSISAEAQSFSRALEAFGTMPNPMFMSLSEMARSLPRWMREYGRELSTFPRFARLLSTPIEDYLEQRLSQPELRRILGMMAYRGTPASFGLSFVSYFLDYYYPEGGVQAIPDALASLIEERGGSIEYRALVEEILLDEGRACGVRLADGRTFRAPFVINDGDARRTYLKMLPASAVPAGWRRRLEQAELAESAFTVFLGVDIPPEELDLAGCHHLLVLPDSGPPDPGRPGDIEEFYRCSFMEISAPSLHDPALAPPGKSSLILHALAEPDLSHWKVEEGEVGGDGKPGPVYRELKEKVTEVLVAKAERYVPGLSSRIEVKLAATPYTHQRYTLNSGGTTVGWTYRQGRGFFRRFMPMTGFRTPVPHLYQVGHWAMTPGGAPSAIISGRMVSDLVRARLRLARDHNL